MESLRAAIREVIRTRLWQLSLVAGVVLGSVIDFARYRKPVWAFDAVMGAVVFEQIRSERRRRSERQ